MSFLPIAKKPDFLAHSTGHPSPNIYKKTTRFELQVGSANKSGQIWSGARVFPAYYFLSKQSIEVSPIQGWFCNELNLDISRPHPGLR